MPFISRRDFWIRDADFGCTIRTPTRRAIGCSGQTLSLTGDVVTRQPLFVIFLPYLFDAAMAHA
jgi:hypothetical protein